MRQATFFLMLLLTTCRQAVANMSDVDQMDTQSETSSTADLENVKESSDPNLVNPQPGQGYGVPADNTWKMSTTQKPKKPLVTTPKPSFSQQSMRAVLELGIIVGVAFMVGGLFMAMVGMEILCDKLADKYRELFKKPKDLPDVERLHPAELVGTFSRYK